jgi:P-type Ca2+ transporter type 2C
VAGNLALIFVSRSRSATLLGIFRRPNRIFWWIAGLSLLALTMTIYVPAAARVFRFEPPTVAAVSAVFALAVTAVLLSGIALRRRPAHHGSSAP